MFNKKQLIYAIAPHILKALIAAGLTIAIVSFFSTRITTMGVTLNEKKVMTLILQNRNESTAALRNTFENIGESDKKIRDAFLATDNVLEFVSAVETLGTQSFLRQTLRFSTPELPIAETAAITIIPVGYAITANGTAATLERYLQQFETMSYFAGIRSITLSTGSPKGWEDESAITLQGTLYTKR